MYMISGPKGTIKSNSGLVNILRFLGYSYLISEIGLSNLSVILDEFGKLEVGSYVIYLVQSSERPSHA